MAEGSAGLTAPVAWDAAAIEEDIMRRRAQLTPLVAELSQRVHELTDVRRQVRRHALGVTLTVVAGGAVAAGSIAYRAWRARRRNTLLARGGRLRDALGRMIDRPERVAVGPTVLQRIIGSASSAAAVFLIQAVLERVSRPRHRAPSGSGGRDEATRTSRG